MHYDVTMSRGTANGNPKRRIAPLRVPITIRLPEAIVKQIDLDLDAREIPQSRNNWLLEAALEKLRRQERGAPNGAR